MSSVLSSIASADVVSQRLAAFNIVTMRDKLKASTINIASKLMKSAALTVALVPTFAQAMVLETSPNDAPPIPPGNDLGILYYEHSDYSSLYVNGDRVPGNFKLESDVGIARFIHWTSLFGFTVTPQVIIPFGDVRSTSADLHSTGVGDPFFGSEIWLLNDPTAQRYFALGVYVAPPLGTYDASKGSINLGSNRWTQVTHLSYSQHVVGPVFLDVTGELAFYSANNDYVGQRLSERPTIGVQAHVRYELNSTTRFGASYFHSTGGRSELEGVEESGSATVDSYRVSAAHFFTQTVQIQLEAGQDIHVSNGPKQDIRVNLRLTKAF
jgi:Putative MetA-pathway of phenol degradation